MTLVIACILYGIAIVFKRIFSRNADVEEVVEPQPEHIPVAHNRPEPAPVVAPAPAERAPEAAAEARPERRVVEPEFTYLYETYDPRSVELFRGFILVYSVIGDAALRLPLIDDYYPYDETLELCEEHIFSDENGAFYHLAAISETLHPRDRRFVQECRNKFASKIRHETAERERKQRKWFRMMPEAEEEEKDCPLDERASRARHACGGYRKVWDGRVAPAQVNERPLPAKKQAPSSAAIVEKLENKVKILKLQKEARSLIKEMVPNANDPDYEDASELEKLKLTHDFIIPCGLKCLERSNLLATDSASFDPEDLLAEEFFRENYSAMVQRVSFGKKTTVKLTNDMRDHTYRSAGLYSDHFTLRDVVVEYFEYDDPSEEFHGWLWTLTCAWVIMIFKWVRYAIFWLLTSVFGANVGPGWVIRVRRVEGKICWELYLELLSRKFISHKSEIEVGYQRMKTRYETYATLNLPSALNGTGVLENSLNLAVCKYLVLNSHDLMDFTDWTEAMTQEDLNANNTSFSDTMLAILRFPVSAQSRRVLGSSTGFRTRVMRILLSPAVLVLWYLGLFPRALAAPVEQAPSTACANVLALGIYLCLVQLYLTYNDSHTGMSRRITALWLRMRSHQFERGWLPVIILQVALISSLKLHVVGAWMWMILAWVVSMWFDQRALTASLRPSFISRIKRLALFVPATITRSASLVQSLLPLSASCMVLTTTSLNTFQSLIGPNTLNLSDWKVRLLLSPTTLLLSLILLRILCIPLNWFYTDICCKIFEIIADSISALKVVSNSCLRRLRRLTVFAFWVQTIVLMLLECLARCSPHWETDFLTSSSVYGCLIGVRSLEWTVWWRVMTVYSWSPIATLAKFLDRTALLVSDFRLSLKSNLLSTVLLFAEWFLQWKPNTSSAIRSGLSAAWVGVTNVPLTRAIKLLACVKQSFYQCFTSVTGALYLGLAPSEGSLFLKAYDRIGLKTIIDGTQCGPIAYFALNNLILCVCLSLALRIADYLPSISMSLLKNNFKSRQSSSNAVIFSSSWRDVP